MPVRQYLCIDQKSFYATVECMERGLDPMTTNLVVADPERSENTICLAVSPSMKALGVKNRCRIKDIPGHIKHIVAQPRMQLYIDYAAEIYAVFLKYIAPEDIHVYSIDESFLDVTNYLKMYGMTAKELAVMIIKDVKDTVGTICTCGIGTNLYLAKIALDIKAKHAVDFIGVLDEVSPAFPLDFSAAAPSPFSAQQEYTHTQCCKLAEVLPCTLSPPGLLSLPLPTS